MGLTDDPNDPRLAEHATKNEGQHDTYLILSDEERSKGFVRPVRLAYRHVGVIPTHPTRPLTDEERELFGEEFILCEEYPGEEGGVTRLFWTQERLDSGCMAVTHMSVEIAETYARDPGFYGATYCSKCLKHLPVEEFKWLGTDMRVGE